MTRRVAFGLCLLLLGVGFGPAADYENAVLGEEVHATTAAPLASASQPPSPHAAPSVDYWSLLFVLGLSSLLGLGVIVKVSRLLHTPLMSLTNAISAIAVVGAIIVTGGDHNEVDAVGLRDLNGDTQWAKDVRASTTYGVDPVVMQQMVRPVELPSEELTALLKQAEEIKQLRKELDADGEYPLAIRILGFIALFASMTNIVSGFMITDRMLKMFKQPGKDAKP